MSSYYLKKYYLLPPIVTCRNIDEKDRVSLLCLLTVYWDLWLYICKYEFWTQTWFPSVAQSLACFVIIHVLITCAGKGRKGRIELLYSEGLKILRSPIENPSGKKKGRKRGSCRKGWERKEEGREDEGRS